MRGAEVAIIWAIVEHPDETDKDTLKRAADSRVTGEGVSPGVVSGLRRYSSLIIAELDRRGYLSPTGRRDLAPLLG